MTNDKIQSVTDGQISEQKNELENNMNQFKNYKEAIDAAYPDIMGDDGLLEPDFDGLDVLNYVDENKLSQLFTESKTLDEFKTNTKQAVKDEEIRREKEWQEQQDRYWQEQFEEQEKMDEIYAKYTVDGDIRNIKPEWFSKTENSEELENVSSYDKKNYGTPLKAIRDWNFKNRTSKNNDFDDDLDLDDDFDLEL